jgi:osmoprotectant transport system ATP-binding protein
MIRLDHVGKRYPGAAVDAVSDLTIHVQAGEIVVLVGPSGCGKTTIMRLINRLIEPSSGRIYLDGEDITSVNADQLRRRIGYVIQQIGLFPHLTIAANIALIPRTLGWPRKRVRDRVDEMLTLVGLDPDTYRRRYPKQLSGGQQQRIGVARALAADPPVMLMDEPFGAIDPITRDRLQDELLALQARIRKTIVVVTHDIQEAIKLGDRIAIFAEGGHLAQYDTPARILSDPADAFVASFIGSGAAVRSLGLQAVGELPLDGITVISRPDEGDPANRRLLVDADGRPTRWLPGSATADQADNRNGAVAVVGRDASLYDALDAMLRAHDDVAVVLDSAGQVRGQLRWERVLRRTRAPADVSPVADAEPPVASGR